MDLIEKRLNNITCKEYCNINNMKYSVVLKEHLQKIYTPDFGDRPKSMNYIDVVKYPEIYISELNNVNIIGANYIIFDENNYCIYDLPFMDDENKYDLKCYNTKYVDKNITHVVYYDPIQIIEEGIMLIAGCSFNYFHFNIEVLTKLALINQTDEYKDVPILVDEVCLRIPQFAEELMMLDKKGHKIIPIINGTCYNVKKLIYISDLGIYPFELKLGYLLRNKDIVINDLGIKLLNENLAIEGSSHRKLFISRRNTINPRVENHNAVEQIFSENGYEIIFPESMTFKDQLKIFSEAKILAGVCGSGLTNIIFTNKNAKIICIQPKEIESPLFTNLAGILGRQCYCIDAVLSKVTIHRYYQNKFKVDEEYLRNFLKQLS